MLGKLCFSLLFTKSSKYYRKLQNNGQNFAVDLSYRCVIKYFSHQLPRLMQETIHPSKIFSDMCFVQTRNLKKGKCKSRLTITLLS